MQRDQLACRRWKLAVPVAALPTLPFQISSPRASVNHKIVEEGFAHQGKGCKWQKNYRNNRKYNENGGTVI
jgi:hypothetical protein